MRRWAAILLLCLVSFYVAGSTWDRCADQNCDEGAPICHVSCLDGCATAPMPEPPTPPLPTALPPPCYQADRAEDLVSLVLEPEKIPPRS